MADIVNIDDARLTMLRLAEKAFIARRNELESAHIDHGQLAEKYRIYTRRRENGSVDETDEELERDGSVARGIIDAAYDTMHIEGRRLANQIAMSIGAGDLRENDIVLSPRTAELLTVATIYRAPEPELSEVTLTSDGKPIERQQHSWPLDTNGRPIMDGIPTISYERWWAGGLRVSGKVHSISRQLLDAD